MHQQIILTILGGCFFGKIKLAFYNLKMDFPLLYLNPKVDFREQCMLQKESESKSKPEIKNLRFSQEARLRQLNI